MKLHLRAADWYEANGSPAMAVEHLLNTSEQDRCVQLVTALIVPTYQVGQHLDRAAVALGARRLRGRGISPARRAGGLGSCDHWADRRSAAVGGDRGRRFVRSGASRRHGVVRLGAGHVANRHLCRRSGAGDDGCTTSPSRKSRHGAPGATRRSACLARRICSPETWTRPKALFAESSTLAAAMGNTDSLVVSEAELAVLAMDRGRWAEAAEHVERALAAIDEYRMHDYATSVLAFAVAARLAVHRGDLKEADRQLTQAMRARPTCTFVLPWLAVRARLQLAKVYWGMGDQTTARHLLREIDDILLHRPELGVLVDEVSEFRKITSSAAAGSDRRVAAHPGGASAAPVPADAPHDSRDRGAAVRVPQHRQLGGRLDLSKTGRLFAQRSRATGDGDRPARRVAGQDRTRDPSTALVATTEPRRGVRLSFVYCLAMARRRRSSGSMKWS